MKKWTAKGWHTNMRMREDIRFMRIRKATIKRETQQKIHTVILGVDGLLYKRLTDGKLFLSLDVLYDKGVPILAPLLNDIAIVAVHKDSVRGGNTSLIQQISNLPPVHHVWLHVQVVHQDRSAQVTVGQDLVKWERGRVHSQQNVNNWPV